MELVYNITCWSGYSDMPSRAATLLCTVRDLEKAIQWVKDNVEFPQLTPAQEQTYAELQDGRNYHVKIDAAYGTRTVNLFMIDRKTKWPPTKSQITTQLATAQKIAVPPIATAVPA